MNEKEAIEHIKKRICCEQPVAHHCRDNCLYGESECAFSLAIKALEKQMPKKPIGFGECPVCRCSFVTSPNYCPNCGQSLDWSAKE